MKPKFLNIDFELVTKVEPKHLIQDFGDSVSMMYSGEHEEDYLLTLEISEWFETEIEVLKEYDRMFSALSNEGKTELSHAIKKELNFGYEAGTSLERTEFSLPEEALILLVKTNCSFGITIYHNEN